MSKDKVIKYSVYIHVSPSNRVYVGISSSPEKRWANGRGYIKNPYFWRCIQKYGWNNINHFILYNNLTLEKAKKKEIELINLFDSTNRKHGYNIREGGDGPLSLESRSKMSISRIGNKNCVGRKISQEQRTLLSAKLKDYFKTHQNPMEGKHHSEQTIQKLKNRAVSNETKEKMSKNHADFTGNNNPSAKEVVCYTKDGVIVKVYSYAKLASIELDLDLSSIIKCCKGKQKTCGGYIWKYNY